MKKFKDLPSNIKMFLVLAIILIIGIVLRWTYIKEHAGKSFKYFSKNNDTVQVNK